MKLSGDLTITCLKNGEFRAIVKRFWDKKPVGSRLMHVRLPDEVRSEVIEHCNSLKNQTLKEFTVNVTEAYLNCISIKVENHYVDALEVSVVEGVVTRYYDVDAKDPAEPAETKNEKPKKAKKN